jgi:hypothetical protein
LRGLYIEPENRTETDLKILKKSTGYLKFFREMREKKLYVERKIHEKCCKKLKHCFMEKGSVPIIMSTDLVNIRRHSKRVLHHR